MSGDAGHLLVYSGSCDIKYGSRARVGLILPSANVAAEPQLTALLPQGVSLHTTRLRLTGSSAEDLLGMTQNVEDAASLLADADVDLIAFHCTAVSTYSEDLERSIVERVKLASDLPVATTAEAILASLSSLRARRLVLVTPYVEHINKSEVQFLERNGIEVLDSFGLGIFHAKDMINVEPKTWSELVKGHMDERADGYFISCTAIRSLEVIDQLEHELNKPVITSNQVMAWYILRVLGIHDSVPGGGTLFAAS
jgi:maleate isomerase